MATAENEGQLVVRFRLEIRRRSAPAATRGLRVGLVPRGILGGEAAYVKLASQEQCQFQLSLLEVALTIWQVRERDGCTPRGAAGLPCGLLFRTEAEI